MPCVADSSPRSPRPRRERLLNRSREWFTEGTQRKEEARQQRRCVECGKALASRRTPYCGRNCQWKFRGRFFWDAARTFVMHRDRYRCQHCGARRYARDLEVDHIIEIAAGGPPLEYANLQTVCRPCHRAKTVPFLRSRPAGIDGRTRDAWVIDWFPS